MTAPVQSQPALSSKQNPATLTGDPFPAPIRDSMIENLEMAYGSGNATAVYQRLLRLVQKVRSERPADLRHQDFERDADWFRSEVIYMFYAERFGVESPDKPNTFDDLIPMLDYLKALGVSTLYILPFLQSPMIDAGFDVSDYRQVREDLGGNAAFDRFLKAAKALGFKLKADLILNHVSDQHPWFRAAIAGDTEKLNYFVYRDTSPVFERTETEKEGQVAIYTEDDGQKSQRRLMFPDIAHSHYRCQTVQTPGNLTAAGSEKYFYHTFYPHQLDLNWLNPAVLEEAVEVMGYWANQGIDIFRLDAIPFFTKQNGGSGENLPTTHAVVKVLSACLQVMAPATVIQAEACQWPKDIRPYFGEDRQVAVDIPGEGLKKLARTDEVQIAYHFPWMPAIWASVVTGDPTPFWAATEETPLIPGSAAWAVFLRVHDELTLEMVDPKTRKLVYDTLVGKGETFRAGLGVSGRLADFLDNDPRRIIQIFSILLSIPGMPILYFGDEIGEQNNVAFMKQAAQDREAAAGKEIDVKSFVDSRDLARAPITRKRFLQVAQTQADDKSTTKTQDTTPAKIFHSLQRLIRLRKEDDALVKGDFTQVKVSDPAILCYKRCLNGSDEEAMRLIVHNLSGEEKTVQLSLSTSSSALTKASSTLLDLMTQQPLDFLTMLPDGGLRLTLAPYQSLWLKAV
jgi:maltose alpha-D-glucosyltransferase/alpha-amylase